MSENEWIQVKTDNTVYWGGQIGSWNVAADLIVFATAIAAVEKCSRQAKEL